MEVFILTHCLILLKSIFMLEKHLLHQIMLMDFIHPVQCLCGMLVQIILERDLNQTHLKLN